ncbi:MAG: hypothetical protein IT536_09590 [Hyphomicrobiales bacterium]|nr:hypothetical protein [Hyphomicrobiales bacterium]
MTAHPDTTHPDNDERLDEPGAEASAVKHPAEYSSPRMWLVGSIAVLGFYAAVYGYGEYQATVVATAASQVETAGAATTPNPPPSTIGQGAPR